jgi:nitrite reductase (NO-forming)
MTINSTNITSRLISYFNQIKEHPQAKQIYIGLFTFLVALIWSYISFSNNSKSAMNMDMSGMYMISFGPGDGFHVHKEMDPNQFERVSDISKSPTDIPGPINRNHPKTIEINLTAKEVVSNIAPITSFHYWTFNETVPGPFLRVRVGDTIKLSLHNDKSSSHDHSIDLHAVTGPGGGAALTEVEPGKTKTMQFTALNPGLFVYHCAAGNAPTHIALGMYGMILVEPKEGLPSVDKEFYLMQGEIYTKGLMGERSYQAFDGNKMIEERPEYIVFNGRTSSLVDNGGIKAKVGDTVRLFVGNGGVSKISSFHVIGEIFDRVYPEASTSKPLENVQTTLIPNGGATMAELHLDYPGDYVLVDHALTRIDRGAWGLLSVSGEKDDTIYSAVGKNTSTVKKDRNKMGNQSMKMIMK